MVFKDIFPLLIFGATAMATATVTVAAPMLYEEHLARTEEALILSTRSPASRTAVGSTTAAILAKLEGTGQ
jgi:hypothetical protein